MVLKRLATLAGAIALVAAIGIAFATPTASAQVFGPDPGAGDLFPSYYVNGAGSVPASLYLSPRPTPPLVGHTWVTYQPLYPHQFLYPHHRTYLRQHGERNFTRTRVTWY